MYRNQQSTKVQSYSGQWNVQVVRGKVTTRCLWNACKALSIGLLLLLIGTTMAIIGYYADQLSEGAEVRGNSTVSIRYESRGFHLNNLSYAGPIVMGVGGFIVVAACVMTFEARDSAAKVVPARLKVNPSVIVSSNKSTPRAGARSTNKSTPRRSTSCQTKNTQIPHTILNFSRSIIERSSHKKDLLSHVNKLTKSPSAPNLSEQHCMRPAIKMEGICSLLSPHHLLPRQAISMDCSPNESQTSLDRLNAMNMESMAIDLHEGNVTLRVKDESAAKKRMLMRQRSVVEEQDSKKKKVTRHQSLRLESSVTLTPCTLGRHRLTSQSQTVRKVAGSGGAVMKKHCCRYSSRSPCEETRDAPPTLRRETSHSSCTGTPCRGQPRQDSKSTCTSAPCCPYTPSRQSSCTSNSCGRPIARRSSRTSCPSPTACHPRDLPGPSSRCSKRASRTRSLSPSCSVPSSPSRKSSLPTSSKDPPSISSHQSPSSPTLPP